MKINNGGGVRPSKLADVTLNHLFGVTAGRLSPDDVQAIAFRHAEIQVATKIRDHWLKFIQFAQESSAPNATWREGVAQDEGWRSVATEVLDYIAADQAQIDNFICLARGHVALSEKVIEALSASFTSTEPMANLYRHGLARDSSPLRYLEGSAAAYLRVDKKLGDANVAWGKERDRLVAEAHSRNAFARTAKAVALARIDACAPDVFEEQVAWFLERDGGTIVRRKGFPNDQAADVIALTPKGLRVVLQVKHSTKPNFRLDPRYVYELNGTARPEHRADVVGIVTNRALSDAAQRFALKHRIHVIDRPILRQWATYGVRWISDEAWG